MQGEKRRRRSVSYVKTFGNERLLASNLSISFFLSYRFGVAANNNNNNNNNNNFNIFIQDRCISFKKKLLSMQVL